MSKRSLLFLGLLFPLMAFARTDRSHLTSGSDLRDWCMHKSSRYFSAKGLKHYNWTASTLNKDNFLETSGEWRVDNRKVRVVCRVKKGAHKRYATFAIDP